MDYKEFEIAAPWGHDKTVQLKGTIRDLQIEAVLRVERRSPFNAPI